MKRALIFDHEPMSRSSLKNRLKEVGFDEIIECVDGEAAAKAALDRLPDIAILDVSLPKMDGFTAAAAIRKRLKIPIIMITGRYDQDTASRAKQVGVAAFLTKPLRDQDVWPAIELAFAHADEVEHLKEQVEDLKEIIENRKLIERSKGILMRATGLRNLKRFVGCKSWR